jgi:peptidyl-tRNA hydrolase
MSFIGDIWGNVKFNAGKAAANAASSVSWAYTHSPSQEVIYRNNRAYKSVLVHVAKQLAMSEIEGQINKLFPKYQRYLEKTLRKTVLEQQKSNQVQLIRNRESQMKECGRITADGGHTIIAKDKYGNAVPESLMLFYDGDTDILVEDVKIVGDKQVKDSYTTKTICFIDINPDVAIQSSKNIVMTTVQGRDYTRKELVSGGDLNFTVTGEIVSNEEGVYPENDVKKFIQIMQYGGVVNVNHFQFKQFNVDKIIIKDFNMQNQEFKNIQPYTFTCVAVEPDEDVVVKSDTIAVINREIEVSPMSKWYKLILNNKYAEIVANAAASAVSSTVNAGVDAAGNGLDKLVDKI